MENQLYSPEFSAYLLNNWTGLASFWTSIHLNNQLKHVTGEAYLEWSKKFGKRLNVKNPPKTQGLLEVHQKLTKNVVLSSKLRRTDIVIQELKSRKISSHRYHKVVKSKHQPKIKLSQEMFYKRRRKRRPYQTKFNESKFQKINKSKVAHSSPTSTSETDQTSGTHQNEIYLNNESNVHLSNENKDIKIPDTLELNQEIFCKRRRLYEKTLNINKLNKINKNKIVSSTPTLASEKDDISEMHQEEISMNSGTETDLKINQTEVRCNEEKPQEPPKKTFFRRIKIVMKSPLRGRIKEKLPQYRRKGSLKRRSIMQ